MGDGGNRRKDAHFTRVKERVHWSVFGPSRLYTSELLSFFPAVSFSPSFVSPFRHTFPSVPEKDSSMYVTNLQALALLHKRKRRFFIWRTLQ